MNNRKKVIKGLECCSQMAGKACNECPYVNECEEGLMAGVAHLADNALSLIKGQEPRVLTLDEIQAMPCDTPICVEEYYGSMYMDIYNGIDADSTDFITGNVHMECSYWIREEYGTLYRFWSAKPTEEQRKEVKWNGIQ